MSAARLPRSTGRGREREYRARLRQVGEVLGRPGLPSTGDHREPLGAAVGRTVALANPDEVWLLTTALSGVVRSHREVVAVVRDARRRGGDAVVSALVRGPHNAGPVRITMGGVLVDVTQTVHTDLVTGIQRVALETVRAWVTHHEVEPVTWQSDGATLRSLTDEERVRLALPPRRRPTTVVIPWRGTLVLPELADDAERLRGLDAVVRHGASDTGMIGYDCVPLTSPETVREGFPLLFYATLGITSRADRLATISTAAEEEYRGWRESLDVVGLPGPEIRTVELPEVAIGVGEGAIDEARALLTGDERPLVLVVGSHEPRKNHLAVLHAAELCWRSGNEFTLAMVGGNAWSHEDFDRQVGTLQRRGRPLRVVSRLPDRLLGAAYRIARFTVFPSLNEGFGLPVAESLAAGTPAITSNFGSMRDIAARGGAVLVDPRDPRDIAAAMTRLLRDDIELERLRAGARSRPHRSWADYAEEVWQVLVTGNGPVPGPSTPGSTR